MPFTGVSVMDLKREFIRLAQIDGVNKCELFRRFEISASLGYRLLARYRAEGEAGLEERSRRPLTSPRRTPEPIEAEVLAVRGENPCWGGRKLAKVLKRRGLAAPAPSTVTEILRRNGVPLGAFGGGVPAFTRFEHAAPNNLWQMDFKGHVAMRTGRLHPLTVLDDHSRFAVVTAACADQRTETVKTRLIQAFRRYGLPWRIMTDNGSPWGNGPGDPYTPLGVWLIEQDITIGHSRPYHPQTLGKDERFHRTLKAEKLSGAPYESLAQAEAALERWRQVYNTERPHEAIGLVTPIERYAPSTRSYREPPQPFEYGPDDKPRRVQAGGHFSFEGRRLKVPKAFEGKTIALRPAGRDDVYDVVFRTQRIKSIDLTVTNHHD